MNASRDAVVTTATTRRRRESNPRTGLCRPLPKPLGHSAGLRRTGSTSCLLLRADDGIRTRDPHLGKVMLYQLSHVRAAPCGAVPMTPYPPAGNASNQDPAAVLLR